MARHQEQPQPQTVTRRPAGRNQEQPIAKPTTAKKIASDVTTPNRSPDGVGNRAVDSSVWSQAKMNGVLSELSNILNDLEACRNAIKRNSKIADSNEGNKWLKMLDWRINGVDESRNNVEKKLKSCIATKGRPISLSGSHLLVSRNTLRP